MAANPATPDEIRECAGFLESQGVVHVFIGGVAMSAWGAPRTTFDLDLVMLISEPELKRVFAAMSERGWVVDEVFAHGFRDSLAGMEKFQVQLPVGSTLLDVDVFLATTPFLRSVIDRRVTVDQGDGPIHVCSAADLILLKLVAGRRKDQLDIENVLTVQGVPERRYLERWARELGVGDQLAKALGDDR